MIPSRTYGLELVNLSPGAEWALEAAHLYLAQGDPGSPYTDISSRYFCPTRLVVNPCIVGLQTDSPIYIMAGAVIALIVI